MARFEPLKSNDSVDLIPQRNGNYNGTPSAGQEWVLDGDLLFRLRIHAKVGYWADGREEISVTIHFTDGSSESLGVGARSSRRNDGDQSTKSYQGVTSMLQLNDNLSVEKVVVNSTQMSPNLQMTWGSISAKTD